MRRRRDRRGVTARRGEMAAAVYLRLRGHRILARNWRCPRGEIDIVTEHRGVLVFVEVKTRRTRSAGAPEDAVDARKQARLSALAAAYVARHGYADVPCRFDVVAVEPRRLRLPRITYLRDAFSADGTIW